MVYNVHRTKGKGIQTMWKFRNLSGTVMYETKTALEMFDYLWEMEEPVNCWHYVEGPRGEILQTINMVRAAAASGQ